jgi:hypothetical protein
MIHICETYQNKLLLSWAFHFVEGPEVVAFHYPVFLQGKHFRDQSALFGPEYLLSDIIGPFTANLPIDIFLMQTDGRVIYDIDTRQIGLNAFSDPSNKPFPDLLLLTKKAAAEEEG